MDNVGYVASRAFENMRCVLRGESIRAEDLIVAPG
jgi:hypothetical protein